MEILDMQINISLMRDCQKVKHRICRAAKGHKYGDGVLQRLPGDDVASGDALLDQVDHCLPGVAGDAIATSIDCGRRSRTGQ